jgi:hypothetical protein
MDKTIRQSHCVRAIIVKDDKLHKTDRVDHDVAFYRATIADHATAARIIKHFGLIHRESFKRAMFLIFS